MWCYSSDKDKTFLQKIKCISGNKINTINATVSTGSFLYISFSMSVYIFHLQCFQAACTNRNSLYVFTLFFAHWSEQLLLLIFGGKFSNNSQCSNNFERARDQHEPTQSQRKPSDPWLLDHIIASVTLVTSLIGLGDFQSDQKGQIFHIKSPLRKQITPFITLNVKDPDSIVWDIIVIQFEIKSMWMCACNL